MRGTIYWSAICAFFLVVDLSVASDPFAEPPPPMGTLAPTHSAAHERTMAGHSDVPSLSSQNSSAEYDLPQPGIATAVAVQGEVFPQPDVSLDPTIAPIDRINFSGPMLLAPAMLGDMLSPRGIVHQRLAARYKVADNTSPMPMRRGFYSFNYFNNPFRQGGHAFLSTGGVELELGNRRASADLRWALAAFTEPVGGSTAFPSDLRTTWKFLFVDELALKISGGIGAAFPVGGEPTDTRSTAISIAPFVGWLMAEPDSPWFIHGFEQIDFPLTDDHQLMLQSDIGIGYWIRRQDSSRLITEIAPTVELHLYTPIGDGPGGSREGLDFDHVLNATFGCTFSFGAMDSLALGLGIPIFSDRDYDVEGQLHYVKRY